MNVVTTYYAIEVESIVKCHGSMIEKSGSQRIASCCKCNWSGQLSI